MAFPSLTQFSVNSKFVNYQLYHFTNFHSQKRFLFCNLASLKNKNMSTTYKLSVNQENNFDFNESDLLQLDEVQLPNNKFHVLKNNKPYSVEVVSTDLSSKKYTVKVNNSVYEVAIANELDQLITEMGIEKGRKKVINAIKEQMQGLIFEINV